MAFSAKGAVPREAGIPRAASDPSSTTNCSTAIES